MKKIFTLIAVALCAMSASAEGTYAYAAGDTPGSDVTSVTGITLSYSTEGTWTAAVASTNWADTVFVAYTKGNGANGVFSAGSVPTGCFYKFAPTLSGTLTVGICLNASKAFYVVKGSDNTALATSDLKVNVPSESGGETQAFDADNKLAAKTYGTVSFSVTANETYYVLCTGSKLGFYGFKFTTGTAGIDQTETIPDEGTPLFNVAGQQVSGSYKGLIIQKGKKFVNK